MGAVPWTPERRASLRERWMDGESAFEIGKQLNATEAAIYYQAWAMKLPRRNASSGTAIGQKVDRIRRNVEEAFERNIRPRPAPPAAPPTVPVQAPAAPSMDPGVEARVAASRDPARSRTVAGLWARGLSASAIGAELGLTKNQVIGIAHRLKLERRPSPIGTAPDADQAVAVQAPPPPPRPSLKSRPTAPRAERKSSPTPVIAPQPAASAPEAVPVQVPLPPIPASEQPWRHPTAVRSQPVPPSAEQALDGDDVLAKRLLAIANRASPTGLAFRPRPAAESCLWPVPRKPDGSRSCGAPVEAHRSCYCEQHRGLAFQKTPPMRPVVPR